MGGSGAPVRVNARAEALRVFRGWLRISFLTLACLALAEPAHPGTVQLFCDDCHVGLDELDAMTRWLRLQDLVFEGTSLGPASQGPASSLSGGGSWFRIDKVVRGYSRADTIAVSSLLAPAVGTRALVWAVRHCESNTACGGWVRVTPQRTMYWPAVSSHWTRSATPLTCDSLERSVASEPDPSGLQTLSPVTGLGLVRIGDTRRPAIPDNGGTWPLKDPRWLDGSCWNTPRFVRFKRNRIGLFTELDAGDQLLVPCESMQGDTLVAGEAWRALFVTNRMSVRLGVPFDSLASLYDSTSETFLLRPQIGRSRPRER